MPVAEADASTLLGVLKRLQERDRIMRAVATAAPRGALRHVRLSTADAERLYESLAALYRSLVRERRQTSHDRRFLATLSRIIPVLTYLLSR